MQPERNSNDPNFVGNGGGSGRRRDFVADSRPDYLYPFFLAVGLVRALLVLLFSVQTRRIVRRSAPAGVDRSSS